LGQNFAALVTERVQKWNYQETNKQTNKKWFAVHEPGIDSIRLMFQRLVLLHKRNQWKLN
jgi:hypothetical protein